VKEGRK